jgi:hypothetical protein
MRHASACMGGEQWACCRASVLTCPIRLWLLGWSHVSLCTCHTTCRASADRAPTPPVSTPKRWLVKHASKLPSSCGCRADAITADACAAPCSLLQTEDGKPAKAITGREFSDEMSQAVLPWIQLVVKRYPQVFPNGLGDVLVLWDNAPWHIAAEKRGLMDQMRLLPAQRMPHVPRSYDFQLPIEWANSILKREACRRVWEKPELAGEDLLEALRSIWGEVMTPQLVQSMFKEQIKALEEIRDSGGAYPSTVRS